MEGGKEREGGRERDGGKEGGRDGGHRRCSGIRLTTEDEEREGGMEGVREGTNKGWREREEVEGGREVEKPGTDAAVVSGLLTLGTHARGLQYLVCLSVCVFSLFWHLVQSGVQTAVSATSARYGHEI